jgi:proteasome beta subunit
MDDRWQGFFGNYLNPSFTDLIREQAPDALFPAVAAPARPMPSGTGEAHPTVGAPSGTTILALRYADGVIVAGDRQATEGYQVAHRRIEKVYKADDYSAIAIAGAAGPSIEMARLFQTELEHYEKVEGDGLSLEGKANKLSQMIRLNLPAALQGLVVVPIFAGFDLRRGEGRIFKYDVTGGRYEEIDYYATGSGGKDARSTLKKLYRATSARGEAIRVAAEALVDAAEEDVGTGGPDFLHDIFPTVKAITRAGYEEVPEAEVRGHFEAVLAGRRGEPV